MKRLLFVMIAFVFILAACGNNSSKDKEASKDSKTINVGTEGTYAPFSFHDKDGKLTGYDIDVIKAVAKEEGLKLKFNETSWDSMFAGLDAGRFDVIANQVGINPDREKKYKFSKPYTFSSAVLVIRENEKDIKDFDDVKGKKLAQTFTSNYGKLAKDKGADITKLMALTNQWIYYCLSVLMVHLMIVCHTWIIKNKNLMLRSKQSKVMLNKVDLHLHFLKKQMMKQFKNSMMA